MNLSFLTRQEQESYNRYQSKYKELISFLPASQQKREQEIYKWIPDVIKIIASRNYQDRKDYVYYFQSQTPFHRSTEKTLLAKKAQMATSVSPSEIMEVCIEILQYRYPLDIINTKEYSIENTAKQCGFEYLSEMIDFCNSPNNQGKKYKENVDPFIYSHTMKEMYVFKPIGQKYEEAAWTDFKRRPYYYIYPFWEFDLKKVDTSNLSLTEYKRMEKQLKCIPSEILINCRYSSYDGRRFYYLKRQKEENILVDDPKYIKNYAKEKGISLSEQEAQEIHILASELLKYGMPLKLIKADSKANIKTIAKKFGFFRINGFNIYYTMKQKEKSKIQFYQSCLERIPKFVEEAKDFYNLAFIINPKETKVLYQNIKNNTGITIEQHIPTSPKDLARKLLTQINRDQPQ